MTTGTTAVSLSREQIAKMTPAELIIALQRRGIKAVAEQNLVRGTKTCPHCDHKGPIEKDFGVRVMRGAVVPQSWCRTCRAAHKQ